jgi:hypothetical protein
MVFNENEILVGLNYLTFHPNLKLQNTIIGDETDTELLFCRSCKLDLGYGNKQFLSSVANFK